MLIAGWHLFLEPCFSSGLKSRQNRLPDITSPNPGFWKVQRLVPRLFPPLFFFLFGFWPAVKSQNSLLQQQASCCCWILWLNLAIWPFWFRATLSPFCPFFPVVLTDPINNKIPGKSRCEPRHANDKHHTLLPPVPVRRHGKCASSTKIIWKIYLKQKTSLQ